MIKESDFYILLDWDNIGFHEMMYRVKTWLLPSDEIKEIWIRASPSLNGFHIYIFTFYFINPVLTFQMRFDWHDDYQKLCMDMLNQKARYRGDLFSSKIYIKHGGATFKEIKMFKYFRKTSYEQWQLMKEKKPYSQKKLLVD